MQTIQKTLAGLLGWVTSTGSDRKSKIVSVADIKAARRAHWARMAEAS